ncbi:hypothetical protein E4U30_002877, partial [Claviceps sp. LM220 group G6]
ICWRQLNWSLIHIPDEDAAAAAAAEPPATLKFQTIRGYQTALINLWSYQNSRGANHHPQPNGASLKALMNDQRKSQQRIMMGSFRLQGSCG